MPASAPRPPRLVLDTNIVMAGLLWNGPPRRLLQAAIDGEVKRGPASKLAQQIEVVAQLPKAKQQFVSQMIETVIAQAAR